MDLAKTQFMKDRAARLRKRTYKDKEERTLFFALKSGLARHRGDITPAWYFSEREGKVCEYCGGPLPMTGIGLDRKDSRFGYNHDNVVWCCGPCNQMKGPYLSYQQMLEVGKLFRKWREEGWRP